MSSVLPGAMVLRGEWGGTAQGQPNLKQQAAPAVSQPCG